jgi:hypothetical protein
MSIENESTSAVARLSESPVEELGFASLQNESVTATPTTEIDVRKVVESFRESEFAVTDERGFDRPVRWVKNSEAALVTMQACPVCRCCQGQPVYAIEGLPFRVVLCTACQTGQLHPRATPEQIQAFYPPEYYGATGAKFESVVETFVNIVGARHVRSLTRGIPAGGKVLDVGCGRGVVLGALADREFEVHGFEISQTAAQGADPRANSHCRRFDTGPLSHRLLRSSHFVACAGAFAESSGNSRRNSPDLKAGGTIVRRCA